MVNLSRSELAVASVVLGILILICGVAMIICGSVWMDDFRAYSQRITEGTPELSHLSNGHGIWSGILFIFGGAAMIVLFKQPTTKMLVVFLLASCIVSLVGWIEVGLLSDFFTHPLGQFFDKLCLLPTAIEETTGISENAKKHFIEIVKQLCKFMATLRGVFAFSSIGACLGTGGMIFAIVKLCAGQNTWSQSQQHFQQPQGMVVMMQVGQGQQQPGQSIAGPQTQMPLQNKPESYVVAQNPPDQVSGHYNIAMDTAEQKAPLPPPSYT